jgi:hypothetical protein
MPINIVLLGKLLKYFGVGNLTLGADFNPMAIDSSPKRAEHGPEH